MNNRSQKWAQFLATIVRQMKTPTMVLIAVDQPIEILTFPPPLEGGDENPMDFCFQQGREFTQSHPSNWRSAKVFQMHVGMELSEQREQVLVSHMDGKEINTIPHDVVRDKQGNIVELRDTGGIIRIASTYLPAFYVGMRTAHLSETQAAHALENEKAKQARFLTDEIKKRMEQGGKDA